MTRERTRAVSDVISFTLVFTTIIFMIGVVTVSGVGTLEDVQEGTESNVAEATMRNYASTLSDHRRSGVPSRSATIKLQGHQISHVNSEIGVRIDGTPISDNPRTINGLVRETDTDERLIYESGALFRVKDGNGVNVRQPPFRCGDNSAHIALTRLNGGFSLSSSNRITLESTLGPQEIITEDANSVTLDIAGTQTDQSVWSSAFGGGWSRSGTEFTCGGINRVVVHQTTVEIDLVS